MKKISLFSISLLAPLLVFANFAGFSASFETNNTSQETSFENSIDTKIDLEKNMLTCIQVLQSAISANGECKEFSTPCEVPEDWKKVNSCADFKEESNIPNLDDVTKRRHASKWAKLREKAQKNANKKGAKTAREHKFLRKSRSFVRKNRNKLVKDYSGVRGVSQKKWGSKYQKYESSLQKKARLAKQKLNKYTQAKIEKNLHHKVSGTAFLTRKLNPAQKKKLSNKFWSTAAKSREKRQKRFTGNSDLIKKALRSRQPFRRAKKKPEPIKRHAHLRKIYKGGSIRGNLNGEAEVK